MNYLNSNAIFEQSCYEQAKSEIVQTASSGMEYIHLVLFRAQQIKRERLNNLGTLTIDEVLRNTRER